MPNGERDGDVRLPPQARPPKYRIKDVVTDQSSILSAYTLCPTNQGNKDKYNDDFETAFKHSKDCDWCYEYLKREEEIKDATKNEHGWWDGHK